MGDGTKMPATGRAWHQRLATLDPLVVDTLLAFVLAVPLLIDLSTTEAPGPPVPFRDADPLGYVLVALLLVPLALRRRYPMAVFTAILAAAVATALIAYHPVSYGFGLIVATYTVARWCDRRRSLVALAAALAFAVFVKVRFIAAGVDIELFHWPLDAAYFAGAWFLGDSIRIRVRQAGELERSREELARRAVEREHIRISRELHDAVGHSLSVMVLYAGAAERMVATDQVRARELLGTVTTAGRSALGEMDRLVRLLREEGPPSATVDDVDALADEFRALGLPVHVTIAGSPRALPESVELSAYRITQEALTNTLKHAGAESAEVRLEYTADAVTVSVVDDGAGCPDIASRGADRHGLLGMRERAATLGGELEVGSGPGGSGFAVRARLPVPDGSAP